MIRNIVKIDEDKCTGCGQCITSCAEGAIELIDGKARVVSETYCDGLGACLGSCPEDAISIEKREAPEFDEKAAKAHVAASVKQAQKTPFVCPGSMARSLKKKSTGAADDGAESPLPSELTHWPVQLTLVPPTAPYFKGADLLLVADCVPFAFADFHRRFLRGKPVVIACPKLDNIEAHIKKLTQVLSLSEVRSLTIVHMEVPCCFGLSHIAESALAACGKDIPIKDVTITIDGEVRAEAAGVTA